MRDYMAEQGGELDIDTQRAFLLESDPDTVVFCLPPAVDNGDLTLLRLRLAPRGA